MRLIVNGKTMKFKRRQWTRLYASYPLIRIENKIKLGVTWAKILGTPTDI
jgi:hypothetical protein